MQVLDERQRCKNWTYAQFEFSEGEEQDPAGIFLLIFQTMNIFQTMF